LVKIAAPYQLAPSRYGPMLVNTNDFYMGVAYLKYGECCQSEIEFLLPLLERPGLVIEVGSNMGVLTVPIALELARRNRTMYAFEPQPIIFQQLCANLAINGLMNVTALPYACGAESGSVSFTIPNYRALGNFGGTEMSAAGESGQPPAADTSTVQKVACFPLDGFVPEGEVALIKIDVEGFELAVLQGAQRTLEQAKPLLYVENDRAATSIPLTRWLLEHGYRLWWHAPLLFNPANLARASENIYQGVASFNMLCVPAGQDCPVTGLEEILEPSVHPVVLEDARRRGISLQ